MLQAHTVVTRNIDGGSFQVLQYPPPFVVVVVVLVVEQNDGAGVGFQSQTLRTRFVGQINTYRQTQKGVFCVHV